MKLVDSIRRLLRVHKVTYARNFLGSKLVISMDKFEAMQDGSGSYDDWIVGYYQDNRARIVGDAAALAFEMRAAGDPMWRDSDVTIIAALDAYFRFALAINEWSDDPAEFIGTFIDYSTH